VFGAFEPLCLEIRTRIGPSVACLPTCRLCIERWLYKAVQYSLSLALITRSDDEDSQEQGTYLTAPNVGSYFCHAYEIHKEPARSVNNGRLL
jgi:hypothetical protein